MPAFVPESAFVSKANSETLSFLQPALSSELSNMRLAVKDLFHIKGLPTLAGNPVWGNTHDIPQSTNSSVTALIQQGAQYIGKTVTDELAYSLNGQNKHYPMLSNPVTPDRLLGGSSSGSAAAVASGQAEIGLGTDTGGSIRVPASYNGLFGLRTTHGAIACDNMVPLAPSYDTVGWLTSNIDDLHKVALSLFKTNIAVINSTKLHADSLRIFIPTNLVDSAQHADLIYNWITTLDVPLTKHELDTEQLHTSETFRILQGAEIWKQHGKWISQNEPNFAYDILKRIQWCEGLNEAEILTAKQQNTVIQSHIDSIFETHDLILLPTTPGCAPLLNVPPKELVQYREVLMSLTSIAGLTGCPQIHLPLFNIQGAPCGLSLVGKRNTDIELISLARQLIMQSAFHLSSEKS